MGLGSLIKILAYRKSEEASVYRRDLSKIFRWYIEAYKESIFLDNTFLSINL